jgi:3'(2'), 5'-bisphosphate nucleotidase
MGNAETVAASLPPALLAGGEFDLLAGIFGAIAVKAGAVVMEVYRGHAEVRTKADASPVCDADEKAELLIQAELALALPKVAVLAEEAAARGIRPDLDGRFVLVDPVDGTKEFLSRNGEFTVNIALIEHGMPRAAAVYAPALERLWVAGESAFAGKIAPGADLRTAALVPIHSRPAPSTGFVVMASRSHSDSQTEDFLARFPVANRRNAGSSLKFCALA